MKPTKKQQRLLEIPLPTLPTDVSVPNKTENKKRNYYGGWDIDIQENYIYMAQAHDKVLIVTVFRLDGTYLYRTFQERDIFFAHIAGTENYEERISSATISSIKWGKWEYWDEHRGNYIGVAGAGEVINQYIDNHCDSSYTYYDHRAKSKDPFERLEGYQLYLRECAIKKRNDRIRESTNNDMLQIRPLPKKVIEWIDRTPLRHSRYIFYRYKSGRKHMDGTCSNCMQSVKVQSPRHRKEGRCPNCRSKVTFIADGRFSGFNDNSGFAYFQTLPSGYCIRIFDVSRWYKADTNAFHVDKAYELHEHTRIFMDEKHSIRKQYEWGNFKQTGSYEWCHTTKFYEYEPTYIYPDTLKRITERDPCLKYAQLVPIARIGKKLNPIRLVGENKRYQWLEYLIKLKLYNLAVEVINSEHDWQHGYAINRDGSNLCEILKVGKADIPTLQEMDPTAKMLRLYQIVKERTLHIDGETHLAIVWWCKTGLPYNKWDVWEVCSIVKARKYIIKQVELRFQNGQEYKNYYYKLDKQSVWGCTAEQVLRDWCDYIGECKELGYDLFKSIVLTPGDLLNAHQEASRLVTVKQNPETNRKIMEREPKLNKKYCFNYEGLLIRPPVDMEELIIEGKTLNHCVGRFADDHASKKTIILFVRKANEPDEPYFTLEYKDNKVAQCRGLRNCAMTPEVSEFVAQWEKHIKKQAIRQSFSNQTKQSNRIAG